MKRVHILALVAIAATLLLTAACNQNAAETAETGPSVAVVNAGVVITQSEAGQRAMAELETMSTDMQTEIEELTAKADEERAALEAEQAEGEDAEAPAEGEQTPAEQELMARMGEFQTQMSAEQNRLVTILNEHFDAALNEYIAENDIDAVLNMENVLVYNDAADITDEMIEAMNARDIDIDQALSEPEGQAAPAPEAETE